MACALALGASAPALTVEELQQVLDRNGIEYDAGAARQAAVRGMLAAVDSGAQWLSADDLRAEAAATGFAVEVQTGGVLWVRLAALRPGIGDTLVHRLREERSDTGQTGVVLDLRQASGSDVSSFEALAGALVRGAPWAYRIRDRQGERVETRASSPTTNGWLGRPLVVLIGESTTETAEMLAAVLSERPGVLLLGEPTRGDGRLRETLPLPGGDALRIATRRWAPATAATGGTDRVVSCRVTPHLRAMAVGRPPSDVPAAGRARPKPAAGGARDDREPEKPPADPLLRRAHDLLMGLRALGGLSDTSRSSTNAPVVSQPPPAAIRN
jgi:hypothetical protein